MPPEACTNRTSSEALESVVAIDEALATLTRALSPSVCGVPVEPELDNETRERMLRLKSDLQERREEAAALVYALCELERRDPHRIRKIQRDRLQNAANLAAALRLLEAHEGLRC